MWRSVRARHLGGAGFPFALRARFRRDIATAAEAGGLGGLTLRILYGGGDEDDVRTVGKMRHEGLCQGERAEVVGCECDVPAQRVLSGAHREDARVVEQPGNREIEPDDRRGRAPHARKIRQVAHDRNRVLPFSCLVSH